MPGFLRQATASQSRALGPFIDDTDFVTPATALTIANTDIKLVVNGAASANKNSGGGTHRVNGVYGVTFDATDTATVGEMEVSVVVAGSVPVFDKFTIVEEAVYDALYAASALGYVANAPVNVAQLSGDSTAADNAEAFFDGTGYAGTNNVIPTVTTVTNLTNAPTAGDFTATMKTSIGTAVAASAVASVTGAVGSVTAVSSGAITEASFATTAGSFAPLGIIDQGTAQSATGTTLVLRAAAAFADDEIIGSTIFITGGSAGVGQARTITDYVSATDTATVETWTTTPTGTITYKIVATSPSSGGSGLDAAGVRSAIGLASANLDTQLSGLDTKLDTIDNLIDTEVGAIKTVTDALPDAGALTSLATQASVNTIDDLLDTEIAAIKTVVDAIQAKTDSLTFTVAGQVDANVESMNAVTVIGAGTSGDKWRA